MRETHVESEATPVVQYVRGLTCFLPYVLTSGTEHLTLNNHFMIQLPAGEHTRRGWLVSASIPLQDSIVLGLLNEIANDTRSKSKSTSQESTHRIGKEVHDVGHDRESPFIRCVPDLTYHKRASHRSMSNGIAFSCCQLRSARIFILALTSLFRLVFLNLRSTMIACLLHLPCISLMLLKCNSHQNLALDR